MKHKIKRMLILELGILFLVLIIFIIAKYKIFSIIPKCIINSIFGIECPSCGGTRCVVNFILGNFQESFTYHPIFFITLIYLIIVNLIYIINSFRKKEILKWIYPKSKFWIIWIVVLMMFSFIRNII